MATHNSYEDWASASQMTTSPDLLETFSGTSIVRWASTIRFRLAKMIEEQEANRNEEYARLIRTFLNIWEANQLTGSINRETLEILKAAASPLAAMKWPQASYFQGLVTSLEELVADQEQLPSTPTDDDQAMSAAGGAGFSAPPLGTDFGPEKETPPGEEAPGEKGPEGPLAPGEEEEKPEIPTR